MVQLVGQAGPPQKKNLNDRSTHLSNLSSKLERASAILKIGWKHQMKKKETGHNTKHAKSMGVLNQTPVAKASLKRKLNRKTRVANRMGIDTKKKMKIMKGQMDQTDRENASLNMMRWANYSKKHTTPTGKLEK